MALKKPIAYPFPYVPRCQNKNFDKHWLSPYLLSQLKNSQSVTIPAPLIANLVQTTLFEATMKE
jgi:hypothetical protein